MVGIIDTTEKENDQTDSPCNSNQLTYFEGSLISMKPYIKYHCNSINILSVNDDLLGPRVTSKLL